MNEPEQREEAVFEAALPLQGAARVAYLDQACAGDAALRERVEGLLGALERAGNLLNEPAVTRLPAAESGLPSLTGNPGGHIGRYKLLQQIGEGGCGVVYMAEQVEPVRRRVALKVLKLGMDTRQVIARFEAERQALALMDHPHIAKVLDAGATDTGRPFFVMELVRGIKITEFCDESHLPMRERLELFMQVCQAVQHAHQKGIIHRDIKPSNILVTVNDGVPVPKVIDFGIAKATTGQQLTDKTLFTAFEQFLGTPAYMSPEQAVMTSLDIDTRSDIYSLGVLLYELLTGQTPFDTQALLAAGFDEMRRTIREIEPARPSTRLGTMLEGDLTTTANRRQIEAPRLIHLVRGDLDWIVMKCLEKDRARRYETANGLAADLKRHLNNEPVFACPPSRLYEFQKTVRRHKFGFAAATAIIFALATGIALTSWQAVRATRAERQQSILAADAEKARQNEAGLRQLAQAEAKRAEAAAVDVKKTLSVSDFQQGLRLVSENNASDALPFLARSLSANPSNDAVLTRLATLLTYRSWMLPTLALKHNKAVNAAEYSPDGLRIVTASLDGTARIWDARTGQRLVKPMNHFISVTAAQFSPDGTRIVTAMVDGSLRVWDAQTGQPVTEALPHGKKSLTSVCSIHFSPDGKRMVTGFSDNSARVWDARTGDVLIESMAQGYPILVGNEKKEEPRAQPQPPPSNRSGNVYSLNIVGSINTADGRTITGEVTTTPLVAQFSPDGERIVTASANGTARVWDSQTGEPVTEVMPHPGGVLTAEFSPEGTRIVTLCADKTARVWDAATGQPLTKPLKSGGGLASAHFHAAGKQIVTVSHDHLARVWDAETGRLLINATVPFRPATSKQLSPDGRRMVSDARVWDAQTGQPLGEPLEHGGDASTTQFSPEGDHLLTVSGNAAYVWETWTAPPLAVRPSVNLVGSAGLDRTAGPQFSPEGRRIVMPAADKTARVWDAQTGATLSRMKHDGELLSARFSPDGRQVLTATADGARVWDAQTGQPLSEPGGNSLNLADFSPDGKRIMTAAKNSQGDGSIRVWDARTGQPLTGQMKVSQAVASAQFSPDGKRIVTTSHSGTALLWDAATGQIVTRLAQQSNLLWSVQFSPDGRRIVSTPAHFWNAAQTEQAAIVWDAETGAPLTEHLSDGAPMFSARFSPDGSRILTASTNVARVWDAETGQPLTEPMKHRDYVWSAQFSPDGKHIVTASPDQTARVWDAQTGQPLTEPIHHGGPVFSAQFSPDGKRIVTANTASDGTQVRVWDIAPAAVSHPDWLLELAEAISGKVLSQKGVLEPTRLDRVETLKRIRQKLETQPDDDWVVWGRWLLADRTARAVSPFAKLTVPDLVARRIQANTLSSLQEAIQLSPTNSRAFAKLALLMTDQNPEENPSHLGISELYARYALKLAPSNGTAWHALGAIQALTGRGPEALESVDRALEIQPKSAPAWELRGEILEKTNGLAEALDAYTHQVELRLAETNRVTSNVRSALMNRARVFRQLGRLEEAGEDVSIAHHIRRRDEQAPTNLMDLSTFFNAGFQGNWVDGGGDNDLSELPIGIHEFAGTPFDVRGLIQLHGNKADPKRFPEQVTGLPAPGKCQRVHLLHGLMWVTGGTNAVARYVFHYADGTTSERPIVLRKDVLNWWTPPPEPADDGPILAWSGHNPATRRMKNGQTIQIYKTTWENPKPEVEITRIDFISTKKGGDPFLFAITVE